MSSPATLPLSQIVDVEIFVSPQSPAQPTFNQGLIVGPTAVIPASERVRQYAGTAAMLTDGFTTSNPEYIAAQLYFSQSPAPRILWIGRQDLTAIETIAVHGANQGTGYSVGDILGVTQGSASGGQVRVETIGGSGAVTSVSIVSKGTGYAIANSLATTTTGGGSGAEMDISAVGDTPLEALQACRLASFEWWACMVTSAVKADHEAIAAFVQTMSPVGMYFFTTADADALAGTAGNVFSALKALSYNRVYGLYSTTQSAQFPNNTYACAASMGVAMGLNTGLPNSAFTMKFKVLTGVATEPLTLTQVGVIEGNNGNVYVSRGATYNMQEQGVDPDAQFLDEILYLDMLASKIQFNVMNLLVGSPKIPQTDGGQTQLIHAVNQACEDMRVIGFLAGGVWEGVQIVNLSPGDSVPKGYLSQSYPYSTQSRADRAARKAMPIFTAIVEAGAVHSIVIGVYVQR